MNELMEKIRKSENLHILFWIVKDSCWMLEWRLLGTLMIPPTVLLALYIVIKTWGHKESFISVAIFFWISANSFWMLMEFFNDDKLKYFSGIPFALGLLFVGLYYLTTIRRNERTHG
jgi:hypothetical protein